MTGAPGPHPRRSRPGARHGAARLRRTAAAVVVAAILSTAPLGAAQALAATPADVAVVTTTGARGVAPATADGASAPSSVSLLAAAVPVPKPVKTYTGPPEPLARYVAQASCEPVERPGTAAFRQLLRNTYGGNAGGITRACSSSTTEHSDGRAYDWMVDATKPADAAKADAVIRWLVGPDAQGVVAGNARRLGVMYIIWDRQIWGSYNGVWKPYTGASPHRDHVHFSLSWDGAMKRTSFWTGTTLTGHDYGPCRRYVGEAVPKYTTRNTSPCPTPTTRPTTPAPAPKPAPAPAPAPKPVPAPAPAPGSATSGISAKYAALGGEKGVLGRATSTERTLPAPKAGWYRHFEKGSLFDSPTTDASMVRGAVRDRWAAMGWERSALGFPVADEKPTPDGRGAYSHFQGGSIYWTKATGAHEVMGAVRDRWASMGWERSKLGYPTSRTIPTVSGTTTFFQGGAIRWNAKTGATAVQLT